MTHAVHLSEDLIARVVDNELTTTERLFAERHLAACPLCRQKRREWAETAEQVQDLVLDQEPIVPANARQRLVSALEQRQPAATVSTPHDEPAWWKWGAVAAAAASLAFMVSLPPVRAHLSGLLNSAGHAATVNGAAASGTASQLTPEQAEWDFTPLPYSGVALAEGEEEIVRVQLPASALANEGIIPPGSYAEDSWVDADLLLGLDGQPQGIRLLNVDAAGK